MITTPATPTTISHQVASAIALPKPRSGKPTDASTQYETPISPKAAQPTNVPRPCAVISAYHQPGSIRPTPAWLSRRTRPRMPAAPRIAVEAIR